MVAAGVAATWRAIHGGPRVGGEFSGGVGGGVSGAIGAGLGDGLGGGAVAGSWPSVVGGWAAGAGAWLAVACYAALLVGIIWALRQERGFGLLVRDWLPLLALPVLYACIPSTAIAGSGGISWGLDAGGGAGGGWMFDARVQGWDRALFGTDPAQTFAGRAPWLPLSEVLHAAYLSYYAIIYLPPLLMYARGDLVAFRRTVLAFTVAMVGCFVVFCVFPVEGPRYAWPAPAGVPDGPIRRVVLAVLRGGSSHGTAFPSSHMAIALAIGLSCLGWRRRFAGVVIAVAILLGLGAVYGGFHYAVDVLVGAGVGAVAWVVGSATAKSN